jgi:hypothetical protein
LFAAHNFFFYSGDALDFENYDIQLIAQSEYKYNPTFYYSDDAAIQKKYKLEKDHLYYCDKNI